MNQALMSPYDGQACSSTIGRCKTYPNAIILDSVDLQFTYERKAKQMSTDCFTQHSSPASPQQLFVNRVVLVDESHLETLSIKADESHCVDVVAMTDLCKLIAESQYSSSTTPNIVAISEPYTLRSAPLGPRSPSLDSGLDKELVKKVTFGMKSAPFSIDRVVQPQPPQKKYSLSVTSYSDDHNGFRSMRKQEKYEVFRTCSGISEGRLSPEQEQQKKQIGNALGKRKIGIGKGSVSAGCYFDALRGPELEILKDSEELLLPLEQLWPFLLRFTVVSFGISLGLATQANLWKVVATSPSMSFLHVPLAVNFTLWCLAVFALFVILTIYALKCLLYFKAVCREFHHPVRVNFFFAPWIGCMLIAIGIPPSIATTIHPSFWCVFVAPLLILELKIYGQWLSRGKRRLSKVANASTHVSLVANFISAILGAQVGWIEPAMFFWAVGCMHYLILFVTLYQRLPTAEALPKDLHPVFFLFIAAPSTASVSWRYIVGEFDHVSKVAYYIALFLFASLVVRVKFFCGFRFSVAWWAYTFPMTELASATIHYSVQVQRPLMQVLAVTFLVVATLIVVVVFVCTILHIMWGSLFPNDIAIAITNRRNRERQKHHQQDTSFAGPSVRKSGDSYTSR